MQSPLRRNLGDVCSSMRSDRLSRPLRLFAMSILLCIDLMAQPARAQVPGGANPIYARVDRPARLRPGMRAPAYPELLRRAQVQGEVVVQFVVDTLGRVEVPTMSVFESTHELFTASVRDRLATLRFVPAMNQGHRVRQLVVGAFEFPPSRKDGTWQWPRPKRTGLP